MRLMAALWLTVGLLPSARAAPIHFLVAEIPPQQVHRDSYIVSIDSADTSRLDHARSLVAWVASGASPTASPGATIVAATIAMGSDGINRDLLAVGQPQWSWHVVAPIDFTDFSIEILDGYPSLVEADLDWWFDNTGGAIAFWNYTVVAELGAVPEPSAWSAWLVVVPLIARRRRSASRAVKGYDTSAA